MRFTVISYGSEGDTRPYVAVCRGLMDAGHEVHLFVESSTVSSARRHGVPVDALAGDIQSTLPLADPQRELTGKVVLAAVRESFRLINGSTDSWMRQVAAHAASADAILYGGLAAVMAEAVAQELNKPAINLFLQPTSATGEFPSPIMPPLNLPGWLNRLTYRASPRALIRRFYGKATQRARAAVFGKSARRGSDADYPILYGFSRHLVQRPRDWPASHLICGHWSLPTLEWQPPSELLDFLAAGPPPIYVGLGAVSSFIRQKGLTAITRAIAGRRALFFPGWSTISAAMLPGNFFVVGDTPHPWLFPLTSMVIHHGGAGTSHTAARAGVPSIALPVGADQFFWAGRLTAVGVAPKYIRGTKLDARSLSASIDFASQDVVRQRAKALGAAMAEENGVAVAVAAIEAHLGALS